MVHFHDQKLDGEGTPAREVQMPSTARTSLPDEESTAPLPPAEGSLFSNCHAWGALNTNDHANEAALDDGYSTQVPFDDELQVTHSNGAVPANYHGFARQQQDVLPPAQSRATCRVAFNPRDATGNSELHTPGPAHFAFAEVSQLFAPQTSDRRFPTYAAPFVQQYATHQYGFAPVSEQTMPYTAFTREQQSSHQYTSRGPVSALSSRRPVPQAPAMENNASSSRTSLTSATAGPSGIPRDSTFAFQFSATEFDTRGLTQTPQQGNNESSKQSFEGTFPRDSLFFGTASSLATGSTVPPTDSNTKRTHDAMDKVEAESKDAPPTKKSSRCLISGCNKVFNRHRDLVRHQTQSDAHRGPDPPYFHCTYCWGLSSARPDNVRRHFRTCLRFSGTIRVGTRGKLVYEGPIAYLTMAKAKAWKASIDAEGWSMTQGAAGGSDDGNGVEGDNDASDGDDVGGESMDFDDYNLCSLFPSREICWQEVEGKMRGRQWLKCSSFSMRPSTEAPRPGILRDFVLRCQSMACLVPSPHLT